MAILSLASYKAKINAPYQTKYDSKGVLGSNASLQQSQWTAASSAGEGAGAAPTTPAVPDRTTTGALGQLNSSGTQRLAQVIASFGNGVPLYLWVCDRLSHQGGLDATLTTPQTTNLPTAALTRYTDGVGVMAGLEVYTIVGGTTVDATVVYDNDSGGTGITSQPVFFGGVGNQSAGRLYPVSLAAGDKGVKKVTSVTLSATTGAAGNFGVTLFKPLACVPIFNYGGLQQEFDALFGGGHMPPIPADACLFYVIWSQTISPAMLAFTLKFVED